MTKDEIREKILELYDEIKQLRQDFIAAETAERGVINMEIDRLKSQIETLKEML